MPITRDGTKRPREPLLQFNVVTGRGMCRIGRRQRREYASILGATVEIRPFLRLVSNPYLSGTAFGGQFDWGGRLQKRNGGF